MALDNTPFRDPFESPYAQNFKSLEQKAETNLDLAVVLAQLKSQMRDSLVLDIGAGESDYMAELARDSKARQYVGVDIRQRRNKAIEGATYIKDDIEHFLERGLPEGRRVVICSGFDSEVTNVNYRGLAHQLRNVLRAPDVIFGFEVPTLERELLEIRTKSGAPAFDVAYRYPELNFYVIRRLKEAQ